MSKIPHNLPSWSRSSLERRRIQRSITKDPELPAIKRTDGLPTVTKTNHNERIKSSSKGERWNSSVRIVSAPSLEEKQMTRKEAQLRNSMNFLKQQHNDTLEKLHEEIERLKTENKELNFKLIVTEKNTTEPRSESKTPRSGSYYRSKIRRLENEMKNMKLTLIEAQKQNINLSKCLQERELSGKKYRTLPPVPNSKVSTVATQQDSVEHNLLQVNTSEVLSSPESTSKMDHTLEHLKLFSPGNTTVLQVTLGKTGEIFVQPQSGTSPRSPTMAECKDIIHHLENTNKKQGQELSKLKEELKGSNTYLVTKTLSSRSHYDQNSVMLPALRPAASSGNIADRRRSQQAMLRDRGKRDGINY